MSKNTQVKYKISIKTNLTSKVKYTKVGSTKFKKDRFICVITWGLLWKKLVLILYSLIYFNFLNLCEACTLGILLRTEVVLLLKYK